MVTSYTSRRSFSLRHPYRWGLQQQARRVALAALLALLTLAGLALSARPAQAAECRTYYTVRRGETLYKIGLKYNLLWTVIAQANGIANPNKIYAGQALCIPVRAQPAPGTSPRPAPGVIPTFAVLSVVRDQTVTIRTANFPANQKFEVRMGGIGAQGRNGSLVTTTDSGAGGAFTATYTIPAALRGQSQIAIRLESLSGYYSYNWFWNNTAN